MIPPGSQVRWKPEPDESPEAAALRGTVREPTDEELAYVATWVASARMSVQGHVIVVWDGCEQHDGAWTDPDDLELVEQKVDDDG